MIASITSSAGKTGLSTCRRQKLDTYLSPGRKINSYWISDLNVRSEILKLLKEFIGETLQDTGIDRDFQNRTSIAQ
jgi:hypothetical protein